MKSTNYIESSASFDFRIFQYQQEISLLPLTSRALDYLESATGRAAGFWAVNVERDQLIEARSMGFRFC